MLRFKIADLSLGGLKRIERRPINDARGAFTRLFCAEELAAAGWNKPVVQINLSLTRQVGAVRGLHFQYPPYAEMKLVMCLKGAVWDVVVDLRNNSPTFLQWHAERMSADNHVALLIPEGFAHGFQVLEPDSALLYLTSTPYTPSAEGGVRPDDPRLGIVWPLPITQLSPRDEALPFLDAGFEGIML